MQATHEVKDGKILSITVVTTFDEIISHLGQDRERQRYGDVRDLITNRVVDALVSEFLKRHTLDVLSAIDPKAVANAVALQAVGELRGR